VEPASRAVEGPRDAERRRREDLRRVDRRALQAPVPRPSGSRRESAHHVKASVETGIATRARDPPGERSRQPQQRAPHASTRPFCDHQRGRAPQPWVSVRRACEPMNGESAEMQVVGTCGPGLVLYSSAAASVWPGSRRCSPGMSVRHRAGSRSYGGGLPPPGAQVVVVSAHDGISVTVQRDTHPQLVVEYLLVTPETSDTPRSVATAELPADSFGSHGNCDHRLPE